MSFRVFLFLCPLWTSLFFSRFLFFAPPQCWRFFDSETQYETRGLNLLLRAMAPNSCKERQSWFVDVRQCRRRKQVPWEDTPLARVLTTSDEYKLLEHRTTVRRIRALIAARGLGTLDAFRLFDSDHTGRLKCSEVYGALTWLGLDLRPEQVHDLVREIDSDHDGLVTLRDFKAAFAFESADEEQRAVTAGQTQAALGGGGTKPVDKAPRPRAMQELHDETKKKQEVKLGHVPPQVLQSVTAKLLEADGFDEVWNSRSTMSRTNVSVWSAHVGSGGMMSKVRVFCIFFFALHSALVLTAARTHTIQYFVLVLTPPPPQSQSIRCHALCLTTEPRARKFGAVCRDGLCKSAQRQAAARGRALAHSRA